MARGLGVLLLVLLGLAGLEASQRPPKIHVYSRNPAENGKPNYLNCYVDGFHPPNIKIRLLKNGEEMKDVTMSDLSFSDDWTFQRLVYAPFTPNGKDNFDCEVSHVALPGPKNTRWDPDN